MTRRQAFNTFLAVWALAIVLWLVGLVPVAWYWMAAPIWIPLAIVIAVPALILLVRFIHQWAPE